MTDMSLKKMLANLLKNSYREKSTSVLTTSSSDVDVSMQEIHRIGYLRMLRLNFVTKSAISVPANGNITNVKVGTLVSEIRPPFIHGAWSHGDNAGAAWYNIRPNDVILLGACEGTGAARSIAANTNFYLHATYILA